VSTRDQNPDSQQDAAGCERVFIDRASGKLASRPKWDQLDEQLRASDELVVTRLSRLARPPLGDGGQPSGLDDPSALRVGGGVPAAAGRRSRRRRAAEQAPGTRSLACSRRVDFLGL
jgi:hypothetical protein